MQLVCCCYKMSRHLYHMFLCGSLHTELKQTGCAADVRMYVIIGALHLLQVRLLPQTFSLCTECHTWYACSFCDHTADTCVKKAGGLMNQTDICTPKTVAYQINMSEECNKQCSCAAVIPRLFACLTCVIAQAELCRGAPVVCPAAAPTFVVRLHQCQHNRQLKAYSTGEHSRRASWHRHQPAWQPSCCGVAHGGATSGG